MLSATIPLPMRPDAPLMEMFVTRLLSFKQVREVVLYSRAHIDRLETAGLFPKRVRLGQGRVGWVDSEIQDWLKRKIAERDTAPR